jgi:hypothetical protein
VCLFYLLSRPHNFLVSKNVQIYYFCFGPLLHIFSMRTDTLLLLALAGPTLGSPEPSSWSQLAAPPAGKKIQWVGHSFHWFLPGPVAQLAKEAGIVGHADLGVDRIGASRPCQHWEKGGQTNAVKEMLKSGKADILTLATREEAPDPCIPKFVELAVR